MIHALRGKLLEICMESGNPNAVSLTGHSFSLEACMVVEIRASCSFELESRQLLQVHPACLQKKKKEQYNLHGSFGAVRAVPRLLV